ncbi:Ubiquitin carboxyl-terminal hydrolase 42 [Coemansia sp. RSA 986]|nr:Ubiquitin carboxyl-terminal hydrolase 42 [Coemansia sp. RSA 986]
MAGAISSYLTILVARRRKAQADASDRTDSNNDEAPADGSFAHSHLFSTSAIGSINGDYYSSLNACSTELVPSYSSSSYAAQVNVSCVRVALSTEVARASTTKYSNNNVCNGGLDGENIQCGAGRSNCSDSSGRHISRDSSVSTRESGISSLSGASGEADVSDNYDNTNSIFSTFSPLDTSSIWTSGSDKSYMMLDADDADSDYEVVNKESVISAEREAAHRLLSIRSPSWPSMYRHSPASSKRWPRIHTAELSRSSKISCRECRRGVSGGQTRRRMSHSLPQMLAIQLEYFRGSFHVNKHVHHIWFPRRLNTKPYLSTQHQGTKATDYDLYAVAVHDGADVGKDRYAIYIKTSQEVWNLYKSGESAIEVSIVRVLSVRADMLFYARRTPA